MVLNGNIVFNFHLQCRVSSLRIALEMAIVQAQVFANVTMDSMEMTVAQVVFLQVHRVIYFLRFFFLLKKYT